MLRISCRAGLSGKHSLALDKLTDHEMIIASQLVVPEEINVSFTVNYLEFAYHHKKIKRFCTEIKYLNIL